VLVIQPFWGLPSNRFLERHLEMLAERDALAAVAVLYPTARRRWRGVPVVSLSDSASAAGRGRWLARALLRRIGLTPSWLGRRSADGLRRLLGATPVDAVLCQYATTAAALWEPLQAARCDLFVHLHGADTVESMCPAGHRERLLEIASRALIICNSQQTRRVVAGWGLSDRCMVVKPLGVEVPVRAPERPRRDEVTVLQLGRLVGAKGPGRTIRAFERACEQGLQGRLLLVGDGPLAADCDRLVADSRWRSRIVRKGAVAWEEGRRLRREADIATQHNQEDPATGQVEAFGVAVVEAMAEGLPVVGTRSGGVVEIVADGVTGVLVEPGDEAAQAAALLRLASDAELRRRMGAAAWQRARECFSVEREAQQLLGILGVE
jgi:glycosyltransferase involved in cell wall biosynthesis